MFCPRSLSKGFETSENVLTRINIILNQFKSVSELYPQEPTAEDNDLLIVTGILMPLNKYSSEDQPSATNIKSVQ